LNKVRANGSASACFDRLCGNLPRIDFAETPAIVFPEIISSKKEK
jgi:hypothetical protein